MALQVTDSGDFVENVYVQQMASTFYSALIGRNLNFVHIKPTFTENDIIKKGYLMKQGSWHKSWKKRYFILRKDIRQLCYYPSADSLTLIGTITLDKNTIFWNFNSINSDLINEKSTEFAIQWKQDEKSPIKDIRLKAANLEEMHAWLDAITDISTMGKCECLYNDWWGDTFGTELALDNRSMRQSLYQKPSGSQDYGHYGGKKVSSVSKQVVDLHERMRDVNFMNDESHDHNCNGAECEVDEEMEDSTAEQAASEALEAGALEAGTVTLSNNTISTHHSQGSHQTPPHTRMHRASSYAYFFDDEDADSDDGDTPTNKTRNTIFRSRSTLYNKTIKEDCDFEEEEYVFKRQDERVLDTQQNDAANDAMSSRYNSNAEIPIPPILERGESNISSKSESLATSPERPQSMTVTKSGKKKGKKEKKEKPAGAAPFEKPTANRYEVDGAISGMKFAVLLENLVAGQEKLFLVMFVGSIEANANGSIDMQQQSELSRNLTLSAADLQDTRSRRHSHASILNWTPICRTEAVKVEDTPDYGSACVRRCIVDFNLLQDPMSAQQNWSHVLIILCKVGQKVEGPDGVKTMSDLGSQIPLARCIIRKDFLLKTKDLVKVNMKILASPDSSDILLSMPEEPHATLGVMIVSSRELFNIRKELCTNVMKSLPYGEAIYCARTKSLGQVIALEQVYSFRYSLSVATAYLELLLQERRYVLDEVKKLVKTNLRNSLSILKTIPRKAAMRDLDNMMVGNQNGNRGPQLLNAVTQAESLQKANTLVKEIETKMMDLYKDCYEHCSMTCNGHPIQGNVIDGSVGGNVLRRSVWKKSPVWQFCATNLNLNVMIAQSLSLNELKARLKHKNHHVSNLTDEEVEEMNSQIETSVFHSLTFGCAAAHYLGFHDGGIRKQLSGLDNLADNHKTPTQNIRLLEEVKLKWLGLLQASGGICSDGGDYQTSREKADNFLNYVVSHKAESEMLFGESDALISDGWSRLVSKSSKLAMRIDAVSSQILCFAVSFIKAMIALACAGDTQQQTILTHNLAMGEFLIPLQSFLSTQGDEMGMIEDLDGAVLWLSLVKFRLVTDFPAVKKLKLPKVTHEKPASQQLDEVNNNSPSESQPSQPQKPQVARSVLRKTVIDVETKKEVSAGSCEDVMITRDEATKGIIVDIKLSPEEIQFINKCLSNRFLPSEHHVAPTNIEKLATVTTTSIPHVESNGQVAMSANREESYSTGDWGNTNFMMASEPTIVVWDEINQNLNLHHDHGVTVLDAGANSARNTLMNIDNDSKLSMLSSDLNDGSMVSMMEEVSEDEENKKPGAPSSSNNGNNNENTANTPPEPKVLCAVKLTGVLFTQGINEMQTLANMSGGLNLKQIEINKESFDRLTRYVARLKKIIPNHPEAADIDRMMNELNVTIEANSQNASEKNVGVLLKASNICRKLSGSLGILCKSGKDRTSMGVTLDQCIHLSSNPMLDVVNAKDLVRIMRRHGVRRMNVYANTGQGMYAFNGFQFQMLPKCYRPPPGTHTGKVAG